MEWLKIILEKAEIKDNKLDIDSLIKEINKEFDKNYVSKDELKNINEQLDTANNTILDLKKNNKDNEALQVKIKEHEDTIKTLNDNHKLEVENLKKQNAVNNLMNLYKVKHPDLLSKEIDLSRVTINDDGTNEGLNEQFIALKEKYKSDMFLEENKSKYTYIPGDSSSNSNDSSSGFIDIIKENQSRR